MPEKLHDLMLREYRERFPTWDWDHPHPSHLRNPNLNLGFSRAESLKPEPGNMEAMFALAFRCTNYDTIDLDQVLQARLLAWGSTVALKGEGIMDLEETFEERQQEAVRNALNLKNRGGNDRFKNMTNAEVVDETKDNFMANHIGFLNYHCNEVDSAERHLARIILTYLPYEDPRQDYFKDKD